MKLIYSFLCAISMCCCSTQELIQPMAYTKEYAAMLQKKIPNSKVIIEAEMTLVIVDKSGKETIAFLDNNYKEYVATPKDKKRIMIKYMEAFIEPRSQSKVVDASRITPMIKDRAWLAEIKTMMKAKESKEISDHVYEDLNAELVIFYAEDSPKNLRYITTKDLALLNLKITDVRSLAIKNLSKIIPKIEVRSGDGFYMITAGGNYEASLILFEGLWDGVQIKVDGDYVIAIPSRDLLLITGTNNKEGIKRIRELAIKLVAESSYHLTGDLFIRREGKFIKYEK